MSNCLVCTHAKRLDIEIDLVDVSVPWAALRLRYGLHHFALMNHKREHMDIPSPWSQSSCSGSEQLVDEPMARVDDEAKPAIDRQIISSGSSRPVYDPLDDDPLSHIEQAFTYARRDPKMQRRIIRMVVSYALNDPGLMRYLYDEVKEMLMDPEMGL